MANTGLKQAIVAYKVRASDGAPLDVDDNPISESGKRQAIALLYGAANPAPATYEVQIVFQPGEDIDGTPTVELSDDCVTGYIYLTSTADVLLNPATPTKQLSVISSGPWVYTAAPGSVVTPSTGLIGSTTVTISRSGTGQGFVVFTNTTTGQTARIYVISVDTMPWILDTGTWNMLGFWYNDSLWKYNP